MQSNHDSVRGGGCEGDDSLTSLFFINRFFYPDESATSLMLTDLAVGLDARGVDVTVIASRLTYDAPDLQLEASGNLGSITIERVWTSRFGRRSLIGRALDYATFYAAASLRFARLARRGDVVVVKTDPPLLALFIAPIAKMRGVKVVNWLQDVFPEIEERVGATGRVLGLALAATRPIRNLALRSAAASVVVGRRMRDHLLRLGVPGDRIALIPNWADGSRIRPVPADDNDLRCAWGLEDAFVVGYSGNLGMAHEIDTLLASITETELATTKTTAKSARPVRWLFIGGGARYRELETRVRALGLTSVLFRPYQPRDVLSTSLSVPDVHLVSLRPDMEGLVVPSKIYGIAAAGRPALFIGSPDGEIATLIRDGDFGTTAIDARSLVEQIDTLRSHPDRAVRMGQNARTYFEQELDFKWRLAAWTSLIEAIGVTARKRNGAASLGDRAASLSSR